LSSAAVPVAGRSEFMVQTPPLEIQLASDNNSPVFCDASSFLEQVAKTFVTLSLRKERPADGNLFPRWTTHANG
jgi:hypothetical protein